MRPLLLALATIVTTLAPVAARAGEPSDPFTAAPAAHAPAGSVQLALLDPFSAPPSAAPRPGELTGALDDPFAAAAAPRCPIRTTSGGVVIQRPTSAACPVEPEPLGLHDPFGA